MVTRIGILAASLASVLCWPALFVGVALAAWPPAQQPGKAGQRAQTVCFLHSLVP